ncbi:hypothetical protein [Candidatus Tisiphia endosymbiont of Micropterix aruncella]
MGTEIQKTRPAIVIYSNDLKNWI